MKIFSFYLPQFHPIPENDMWWGKGFTEWVNSKKAKPLFEGHIQPKEPLNNNYYTLLDYETVKWQTDMAKEYGIDGFVYYHYYFKGKKLLEKPAENYLKWKDISHNYYFCWANHTWYKSENGVKSVLQQQVYGVESDWREHFEYLLPFFKDDRYEKIDNKPVFMLFLPHFKEKRKMFQKFDEWSRKEGFDGMYFIETALMMLPDKFLFPGKTSLFLLREPNHSKYICDRFVRNKGITYHSIKEEEQLQLPVYDGNVFYDIMIKHYHRSDKIIHCLFFEWDNTPRHGGRGYVILPPTKEKVMQYLNLIKDDRMLLVNAWNEWAEGMMLEPTAQKGYQYLEWIKEWKGCVD
ncbi:MAG: glycoside hydrolase family 99-like domain-containing protein [Lachnospiraceae bacterium]|nr:glycoside hydrolase family 99-like domain-containing protein [Lachnospiraceae bacterium]